MSDEKRNQGTPGDETSALFVTARKKQLEEQEVQRKAAEEEAKRRAAEEEVRRLEAQVAQRKRDAEEESRRIAQEAEERRRKAQEDAVQEERMRAQGAPPSAAASAAPAASTATPAPKPAASAVAKAPAQKKMNPMILFGAIGGGVVLIVAVVLIVIFAMPPKSEPALTEPLALDATYNQNGYSFSYPTAWKVDYSEYDSDDLSDTIYVASDYLFNDFQDQVNLSDVTDWMAMYSDDVYDAGVAVLANELNAYQSGTADYRDSGVSVSEENGFAYGMVTAGYTYKDIKFTIYMQLGESNGRQILSVIRTMDDSGWADPAYDTCAAIVKSAALTNPPRAAAEPEPDPEPDYSHLYDAPEGYETFYDPTTGLKLYYVDTMEAVNGLTGDPDEVVAIRDGGYYLIAFNITDLYNNSEDTDDSILTGTMSYVLDNYFTKMFGSYQGLVDGSVKNQGADVTGEMGSVALARVSCRAASNTQEVYVYGELTRVSKANLIILTMTFIQPDNKTQIQTFNDVMASMQYISE